MIKQDVYMQINGSCQYNVISVKHENCKGFNQSMQSMNKENKHKQDSSVDQLNIKKILLSRS